MFFHKKQEEDNTPTKPKKVYDIENDKNKKVDISAKFDETTDAPKKEKKNETIEFTLDLESGEILDSYDNDEEVEQEDNEEEEYEDEAEETRLSIGRVFKFLILTLIIFSVLLFLWAINSNFFSIVKVVDANNTSFVYNDFEGSGEEVVQTLTKEDALSYEVLSESSKYIGKNIFLIETSKIKRGIESIPYVYKASISRKLPDTLLVSYTVRKPYTYIESGDTIKLVDQYGEVLEKVQYKIDDLPTIYGINIGKYSNGKTLEGIDQVKYKNAVYMLETATTVGFNYSISDINYKDSDNVIFRVKDLPIRIIYGEMEKNNMNDKMMYLNEILNKSSAHGYKGTLDISSEDYLSKSVLNSEI